MVNTLFRNVLIYFVGLKLVKFCYTESEMKQLHDRYTYVSIVEWRRCSWRRMEKLLKLTSQFPDEIQYPHDLNASYGPGCNKAQSCMCDNIYCLHFVQ